MPDLGEAEQLQAKGSNSRFGKFYETEALTIRETMRTVGAAGHETRSREAIRSDISPIGPPPKVVPAMAARPP